MVYFPKYKPTSPYSQTPMYEKFMGYYVAKSIPSHEWDKVVEMKEYRYVNRPDLLAYDIYGDDLLFWVIPVRSGFQDLYFDLTFGCTIIIPHPSYVRSII